MECAPRCPQIVPDILLSLPMKSTRITGVRVMSCLELFHMKSEKEISLLHEL